MSVVKFSEVAHRANTKEDRFNTDKIYYVGGEHIEPGELFIHDKGFIKGSTIGPMFYCGFKSGQILFVTRNPHLRKCSVAEFDGICSEKTFVIETIDKRILLQEYLASVMLSDDFWNYCEENKSGGVNYFLNWSTLADYEFELPSVEEQKAISDKVWAAYRLKESYKKLLAATEEMVKSQFIEMFGIAEATKPLADFVEVSFPGEWGQEDKDGSGVKVIRTTNFTNNGKLDLSEVVTRDIDSAKIEKKKLFKGDIILERSGGTNDNPVGRVVYFEEDGVYLFNNFTQLLRCKEGVNSLFIFYSLFNYYQMNKNVIRSMGNKTTGIQNLKMDRYWQIPIADVSIELQKEFESIYRQADKSGFVGFKSQFIELFGCLAERVALSSLCDTFIDGDWIEAKDQSGSGIRLIQTGNVGVGTFKDKGDRARYISEETFNRLNCTEVVEGDILISRLPEPVGRACIIPAGLGKSITAVDCTIIRLNDKVLPKFFVAFTNTPDYAMQIKKVLSGTTRLRVSRANLGKIQVPLPSIDKQQQFVTIAEQADKSGFELRKSIDAIDAVIKSLINS